MFFLLLIFSAFSAPIDLTTVEKELSTTGLTGFIHGSAPEWEQYVFSYRDPKDFFTHYEFPLITKDANIKATLKKLKRHDEVLIKGRYAKNSGPTKHIRLSELTLKKPFTGELSGIAPHKKQVNFPKDLEGKTTFLGKVHAVAEEGKILVVEYKDGVIPVYAPDTALTKNLWRNDKVEVEYELRESPSLPSHVTLKAIKVVEKIAAQHGKTGSVEGQLILFPKSPQVLFNVFAIKQVDSDGLSREWTLVNFENNDTFTAIRKKLQEIWDSESQGIVNDRNKFLHTGIRIRASGTFNVQDPGQANPQVLLENEGSFLRVQ